jgi:Txe/YoeB family toxin of Txe-Axe toxin-antitoxin module
MKEKSSYELIDEEFLNQYTFSQFDGKWHLDLYMDGEQIGSILFEDIDHLMHILKNTKQFIHKNVQNFIEEIHRNAKKCISKKENLEKQDWRMNEDIVIHTLKEIKLLESEFTKNQLSAFYKFEEMFENMNTTYSLKLNKNPVFIFKMVWGY